MAAKQAADIAATRNVRRTLRSNLGRFHIGGHLVRTGCRARIKRQNAPSAKPLGASAVHRREIFPVIAGTGAAASPDYAVQIVRRSVIRGTFMHLRRLILSVCLLVVLPAAYALGAETAVGVAMDDFSYTDTSAEPANQTAAHERRLAAFMAALRQDIGGDPRYRLPAAGPDRGAGQG